MWAIVEIQSKNETLRTEMTKKEMLSDIAANDYSRLRNVHSDFLLLDSRANNARMQFNMGLIEFKQQEDSFSQCRYAALELVDKLWPWDVSDHQPNFGAQAERERLRVEIKVITDEEILKKSAEIGIHPNSPFARKFADGANWAISKMNEGTIKSDDWTEVSELLPPVNTKVECAVKLPGLVCKALLFEITRNDGEAYVRFLVDDPDKIIFICPKYWRFIK